MNRGLNPSLIDGHSIPVDHPVRANVSTVCGRIAHRDRLHHAGTSTNLLLQHWLTCSSASRNDLGLVKYIGGMARVWCIADKLVMHDAAHASAQRRPLMDSGRLTCPTVGVAGDAPKVRD